MASVYKRETTKRLFADTAKLNEILREEFSFYEEVKTPRGSQKFESNVR